jgi:hypothetical protein
MVPEEEEPDGRQTHEAEHRRLTGSGEICAAEPGAGVLHLEVDAEAALDERQDGQRHHEVQGRRNPRSSKQGHLMTKERSDHFQSPSLA